MMHHSRFTIIFIVLAMFCPFVGCGIDTNPFPSNDSADPMPEAGEDTGSATNTDADPNGPDADSGAGENDSGCESTPTDDGLSDQGLAPYTIFHADRRKILVGDVGSVGISSLIQISDEANTAIAQTESGADGSFAIQAETSLPGTILLSSAGTSDTLTTATIGLRDATTAAYSSSTQLRDAWIESDFEDQSGFSLEQAGDTIELIGNAQTLLTGLSVVIANLTEGMAMVSQVNVDGSFSVWVQAESGDSLVIFTVEHGSSNGGGAPLSIETP